MDPYYTTVITTMSIGAAAEVLVSARRGFRGFRGLGFRPLTAHGGSYRGWLHNPSDLPERPKAGLLRLLRTQMAGPFARQPTRGRGGLRASSHERTYVRYYGLMRTTQRKGDIATAKAVHTFTALGYDVALPLTESAAYDLVVDEGTRLVRVQCKYTTVEQVGLRRIHSNSQG